MNDLIKELLDQTDIPQFPLFENSPPAWVASDYDMEKFAELIVKECLNATRGAVTGLDAFNSIKQHFGVEE